MAKKGYVFPGQGAQFSGMGKDLYEKSEIVKALFDKANDILGFRITDIMFGGSEDELKQTNVTQPAVFLHSVAVYEALGVLEGTEKAEHLYRRFAHSRTFFGGGHKTHSFRIQSSSGFYVQRTLGSGFRS